jgi:hypothetical protein
MNKSLTMNLPYNIILYILQFDNRFIIKNGRILDVHRFPYDDYRYLLLEKHLGSNCFVNKYDCSSTNVYGELSVHVVISLIINNKKMYQFTIRHLYLNSGDHIRRHLQLRINGIATEKYINV